MPRRRMVLTASAVLAVVALIVWLTGGSGQPVQSAGPTTSTSPAATATTATSTSTTTTTAPATTTTAPLTMDPEAWAPPTTAPPPTVAPTTAPTAPPTTLPPVQGGDRSVYVLGDSVLLGAAQTVPAALAGWDVTYDCEGSRRLPQGIEVLRAHRQQIGAVVVIQMGNNYIEGEAGTFASQIDQAMTVLTGVARVVWLTVAEKWPSRVAINQAIRDAPSRWPNAVVGDWAALVAAHPEYAADQLHLTSAGRVAIAQLIASKVGPPPP